MEHTSFSKALFFGKILEDIVFPYPEMEKDEQETCRMLLESFHKYAADNIDPKKIDKESKVDKKVWDDLGEMGLLGLTHPDTYGGASLSATAYARIFESACAYEAGLAVGLGGHMSIGSKGILNFGTEAQKKKYITQLSSGKKIGAFCLTEPGAGSDAAGIKTKALLSEDGKHFILNGSKLWITNGGIADIFTVFAKTEEINAKTKEKEWKITAFIVEREMGVKSGPEEHKLGIRGSSTTELHFENCKVPVENVLGERGRGFKVAMHILNDGRLGLAAGCIGGCKKAIKLARDHAVNRKQFRQPISEFGMIQDKISNMVMKTYAAESMAYMTTGLVDKGVEDYSLESAICKVFSSETAWEVVDEAMQVGAGTAYMEEYPYEKMLRDTRINIIFEGTNEILRCFIALAGFQGPGLYLKEIGQALRYPIKGLGVLSEVAVSRIKRDIVGLGDRVTKASPELKTETAEIETYVKELARVVEKFLIKYKKDLWKMEFVQKRIANILIDLYAMFCTVSRTTMYIQKKGVEKCPYEIQITQAFCRRSVRRLKRNFKALDKNDDDQLKDIANKTYELGGYVFDVI